MAELAYAMSTGNLAKLFKHIQTAGKPDKVTVKYLKGATAHQLRQEFPHLKQKLPSLWTNCCKTASVAG